MQLQVIHAKPVSAECRRVNVVNVTLFAALLFVRKLTKRNGRSLNRDTGSSRPTYTSFLRMNDLGKGHIPMGDSCLEQAAKAIGLTRDR